MKTTAKESGHLLEHMDNGDLPVMESFLAIQGEGAHQGKAAYFIRLSGCDIACSWCDTKDSWHASEYPLIDIKKIAEEAGKHPVDIAVITGGEPLIYNLDDLCMALHKKGLKIHLETSGAYPLSGQWDWVCLSPKKFKPPLPGIIPLAHELKVVIHNKADFQWAELYARQVSDDCALYLQPEWDRSEMMMPLIVEYIKKNPKWRISLQLHKYLNIP